jgi:hypothetical protein
VLDGLAHNTFKMKEEGVLIYEKERENFSVLPSSGVEGAEIEPLLPFLMFVNKLACIKIM